MRLGQAGRRPFGPEPGSGPGAVWPPTWAGQGRAGSYGSSPGGSGPNSWLSPQRLDQANYRAVAKPGYKRVDEPARDPRGSLEWPGVPQPAPERLALAATPGPHISCSHTILHTSAHTQSHNITTLRPHTVNQTPCSGRGEGRTTQRGLRGGAGALFTQLKWRGLTRPGGLPRRLAQATPAPHLGQEC